MRLITLLAEYWITGQLQNRLSNSHDRQSCWEEHTHEDIGFGVLYTGDSTDVDPHNHTPPAVRKSADDLKERLLIENKLQ